MNALNEQSDHLLWTWDASAFMVLVPKRRGTGFLRMPLGHHFDFELSNIETAAGCDICGLDGALVFEVALDVYCSHEQRDDFSYRIVPLLTKHYGLPAQEVSAPDFWALRPI
jgi:hypothetical protein